MPSESSDHPQEFRAVNADRTRSMERIFRIWMISITAFYSCAKLIGIEDYQLDKFPAAITFIKFSFPSAIYWLGHTNYPSLAAVMWIMMIITTPLATIALLRAIGIINIRSHPRTLISIVVMFTAFTVFGFMDPVLNAESPHGILGRLYTRGEIGVALLPTLVGTSAAFGTAYAVSYMAHVLRASHVSLSKLIKNKAAR